jgi:hypothetical protein
MSERKSDGITRFLHMLQGIGKPKDETVLRAKKEVSEDTVPPVSGEMEAAKLARVSNNRLTPLDEKPTPGKEQWQKLKESAKDQDACEGSIERWSQKQGSILTGTTFDAASTDVTGGRRKRPTVVTQARITNHRLQSLQAAMEKPKNDIDRTE